LTKVGKYVWIKIGKEMAKFHQNVLSMSENIAKTFFFWGGATFLTHTVQVTHTRGQWTHPDPQTAQCTLHKFNTFVTVVSPHAVLTALVASFDIWAERSGDERVSSFWL